MDQYWKVLKITCSRSWIVPFTIVYWWKNVILFSRGMDYKLNFQKIILVFFYIDVD